MQKLSKLLMQQKILTECLCPRKECKIEDLIEERHENLGFVLTFYICLDLECAF